jgi:hypothetical protein
MNEIQPQASDLRRSNDRSSESAASQPKALFVVGPTASGKSALALAIAERLGGAIINADSMQLYRELHIITARPSAADGARAPHLLYGVRPAAEAASVAWWRDAALKAMDQVQATRRFPIICGGTGMYCAALTQGLAAIPPIPAPAREEARRLLAEEGPAALHARLAATERTARQARHAPAPPMLHLADPAPHLLLLQLESFCDPRRFGLAQPLPHKDRLAQTALTQGSLAVSAFGANTMRTEFAVLTGLEDTALGLDRFNPYFRFARQPIGSLAWELRGAGYQTLCLHPFDARFFGRDKVLPALGFARFDAAPAFEDAAHVRGLVSDAAIAQRLAADLAAATLPGFWYVITVAAHGPWEGDDPARSWADCMAASDAMLGEVMRAAKACPRPVVVVAFGDHRPALPIAQGGKETDYVIWRSDRPGDGRAEKLNAVGLHRAIRDAMQG